MALRALFVGFLLVFAGCSSDPVALGSYVGSVTGSDAVVGAVVDGDRVALYVCGGATTFATHSRWFEGIIVPGDFLLSADGWFVDATLGTELTGTLTAPDNTVLNFSAAAAGPGLPGLFEASPDGCRSGVVVLGTNQSPMVQGVWCDSQGQFQQVTPMQPVVLQADGLEVRTTTDAGLRQYFVNAVQP